LPDPQVLRCRSALAPDLQMYSADRLWLRIRSGGLWILPGSGSTAMPCGSAHRADLQAWPVDPLYRLIYGGTRADRAIERIYRGELWIRL